jgi:hypothetical protein
MIGAVQAAPTWETAAEQALQTDEAIIKQDMASASPEQKQEAEALLSNMNNVDTELKDGKLTEGQANQILGAISQDIHRIFPGK